MIAVALFFDGIQFGTGWIYLIPYVGFFLEWAISSGVSIFAFMTFFLWFHLAGLKFNSKIAVSTAGAFFVELIPGLSLLPAWTIFVVTTLLLLQTKKIVDKVAPGAGKIIGENAKSNKMATPPPRKLTKLKQ